MLIEQTTSATSEFNEIPPEKPITPLFCDNAFFLANRRMTARLLLNPYCTLFVSHPYLSTYLLSIIVHTLSTLFYSNIQLKP